MESEIFEETYSLLPTNEKKKGNNYQDLTGQKFGRLTVIADVGRDKTRRVLWLCHCDCGNTITITRVSRIQSCGCLHKEMVSKLGKRERIPNPICNKGHLYTKKHGECTVCKKIREDSSEYKYMQFKRDLRKRTRLKRAKIEQLEQELKELTDAKEIRNRDGASPNY